MMARTRKARWVGALLILVVGVLVPSSSWAQAARAKKENPRVETEIEEITVTAQKREESLQETPLSITALTPAALEQQGAINLTDLGGVVPNLHINAQSGTTSTSVVSMRGLSTGGPDAANQPSVGLYVDGVYIAKMQGSNLDLDDLQRIEVLRGPQGTLYGRNTIGGAVNFITQKPTEERSITVRTEAGNYDSFRGRVTLNLPLNGKNGFFQSDTLGTLSLRENAGYKTHDGFYRNTGTGSADFDNLNRVYTTTALRWQPTQNVTIDYSVEYHRYRDAPTSFQDTFIYPGSSVSKPGPFDLRPYVRTDRVDAIANNAIFMHDVKSLHRLGDDGNHRMHTLTGAWNVGEMGLLGTVTVKSIASYRAFTSDVDQDLDGSALHAADFMLRTDTQHWSEELQWVGTARRVNYVLGAYYYGEYASQRQEQVLFGGATNLPYKNYVKTKSYAPFGQLTWTPPFLSDRLSVTGGLRYTQEQVHIDKFNQCVAVISVIGGQPVNLCNRGIRSLNNFTSSRGKAFGGTDALTPMADLAYQWTDELMTYFRVSRGFRGGGFNGTTSDPIAFAKYFDPEKLWAYEAGFKSQWFDNRLRLNADGFFSDYTDLQISVLRASPELGNLTVRENAGKAEIWGMEFEGTAVPLPGFEVSVNYSFIAPKYTEWLEQKFDANNHPVFDPSGNPVLVNVGNQRDFGLTPKHTITVGLTYTAPPMSSGTFSAHLDTYWQDRIVFEAAGTHPDAQAAYALVNGRMQFVGIPLQKGSLDLAVFTRNLLDRKYRASGVDFGQSLGWAGNLYGNPRTFGLQLTYNFVAS